MQSKWQVVTLAQAGVSLIDCDHRTPPAVDQGYPYIAIPQLKDGHVTLEGVRRISREHFDEWTKKLKPREHDVIVVRRCNSGVSAVVPRGAEWAIGQNLVVLRADGRYVRPEFLRWLVRGEDWWEQVRKYVNVGAVFDSLKCRDIPHFEVRIPSLPEQDRICEVLNAIDLRIDLLRQTNATLEAVAEALFKSWFIDFDPVRAKAEGREPEGMDAATAALFPAEFGESALGVIPKGWSVKALGELCESIFSGGTPDTRKPEYWNGTLPWFSSGETRESIVIGTEKHITKAAVENSSTRLARPGDILIASAGQGLTRGQTSYCALDTYINQSVISVRTRREAASSAWTFYDLSRRYDQLRGLSDSHSIRGSLTTKLLASLRIVAPPTSLMQRFAATAEALLDTQAGNRRRASSLMELRDTLLPRLISGKLRLPEAQAQLEEAIA